MIKSFNEDKPIDRFITEQLAGDELAGAKQGDWTPEQIERERHSIRTYLKCDGSQIHWDLIALALRSNANTAIYPLQDVLGMDSSARMNVPGRESGNWAWRFRWEQLTPEVEQRLGRLTREANRA